MDAQRPTHPSYRELLLLSIDELPAQRAEEVREHLFECEVCLAQMRELLRLPETPPLPEMAIDDDEQEAAWQQLQAAIAAEAEKTNVRVPDPPQPRLRVLSGGRQEEPSVDRPGQPFFKRFPALMVAALFLAAVGTTLWRSANRLEPTGTVSQFDMAPRVLRGDPVAPFVVDCAQEGGSFVWIAVPRFETTEVPRTVWGQVLGPDSRVVTESQLPVNQRQEVALVLRRSQVPDGTYLIQVFLEKGGRQVGERYITVECP